MQDINESRETDEQRSTDDELRFNDEQFIKEDREISNANKEGQFHRLKGMDTMGVNTFQGDDFVDAPAIPYGDAGEGTMEAYQKVESQKPNKGSDVGDFGHATHHENGKGADNDESLSVVNDVLSQQPVDHPEESLWDNILRKVSEEEEHEKQQAVAEQEESERKKSHQLIPTDPRSEPADSTHDHEEPNPFLNTGNVENLHDSVKDDKAYGFFQPEHEPQEGISLNDAQGENVYREDHGSFQQPPQRKSYDETQEERAKVIPNDINSMSSNVIASEEASSVLISNSDLSTKSSGATENDITSSTENVEHINNKEDGFYAPTVESASDASAGVNSIDEGTISPEKRYSETIDVVPSSLDKIDPEKNDFLADDIIHPEEEIEPVESILESFPNVAETPSSLGEIDAEASEFSLQNNKKVEGSVERENVLGITAATTEQPLSLDEIEPQPTVFLPDETEKPRFELDSNDIVAPLRIEEPIAFQDEVGNETPTFLAQENNQLSGDTNEFVFESSEISSPEVPTPVEQIGTEQTNIYTDESDQNKDQSDNLETMMEPTESGVAAPSFLGEHDAEVEEFLRKDNVQSNDESIPRETVLQASANAAEEANVPLLIHVTNAKIESQEIDPERNVDLGGDDTGVSITPSSGFDGEKIADDQNLDSTSMKIDSEDSSTLTDDNDGHDFFDHESSEVDDTEDQIIFHVQSESATEKELNEESVEEIPSFEDDEIDLFEVPEVAQDVGLIKEDSRDDSATQNGVLGDRFTENFQIDTSSKADITEEGGNNNNAEGEKSAPFLSVIEELSGSIDDIVSQQESNNAEKESSDQNNQQSSPESENQALDVINNLKLNEVLANEAESISMPADEKSEYNIARGGGMQDADVPKEDYSTQVDNSVDSVSSKVSNIADIQSSLSASAEALEVDNSSNPEGRLEVQVETSEGDAPDITDFIES
jgi:hypothetical protein